MDREQADAIAKALLDPELQARDELQRKLALKQARRVRQRRVATLALVLAAAGAAAAQLIGQRWFNGFLVGALIGYILGWVFTRQST
jgi:F0F1-type ATP synthase assembly protein I